MRKLTSKGTNKVPTIKDKDGKVLTSEDDIQKRWTEYAHDLYNYDIKTDVNVLAYY